MRIAFWFWDPDTGYEAGARAFDDESGLRATALSLIASETITCASRDWPVFGDDDEEFGYIISDRLAFDRLRRDWPDLDYYECERFTPT